MSEIDFAALSTYIQRQPLPSWVTELRPHQVKAVAEIVQAYEDGADVVFLDAPTGSGKTLIAELVGRVLDLKRVYVCSDKSLQAQFERDFPRAVKLMGRGNYRTQHGPSDISCDDCTSLMPGDSCRWCDHSSSCPYTVMKDRALAAELAVLNTAYFLASTNYTGAFTGREFVVVDEADVMENVLLGFVEFKVPKWMHRIVGPAPKKGAHKPTVATWIENAADAVFEDVRRQRNSLEAKQIRSMESFAQQARDVAKALRKDVDAGDEDETAGRWIRVYDDGDDTLHLKPVLVGPFAVRNLWRHARKWLFMSATLVSVDEMVDTLSLPLDFATVTVDMTFPVENRPVILAPVASMTHRADDDAYRAMAFAIQRACELHPGERVLIHTVSRRLAARLIEEVEALGGLDGRRIVEYRSARERDMALRTYMKHEGSVLFAQSMTRGIDLPGDACRVQIIAKVPFPYLGDKRTSARMHLPGGQSWYSVQAVREVVQMTGRGVRSATDHATTYIFDAQFSRNLWRPTTRRLFPAWWIEAVDRGRDTREFIEKR